MSKLFSEVLETIIAIVGIIGICFTVMFIVFSTLFPIWGPIVLLILLIRSC